MDDLKKIELMKRVLLGVWIFAALSFVPPFSGMAIAPLGMRDGCCGSRRR